MSGELPRLATEKLRDVEDERDRLARRLLMHEDQDLVNQLNLFFQEMSYKLGRKLAEGRSGWSAEDDPDWTVETIKKQLVDHVESGDSVDVANFALFWWSMERRARHEGAE